MMTYQALISDSGERWLDLRAQWKKHNLLNGAAIIFRIKFGQVQIAWLSEWLYTFV